MKINIAIAEDNYFLAKSIQEKISFFPDLQFTFHAENGQQLIDYLEKGSVVDVILMDIQMPVLDGIAATEIIHAKFPQIKIIMLTVLDDENYIFDAIKAGAGGYLLKEIDPEKLHSCIHEIIKGGAPMSPTIALKALKLLRNPIENDHSDLIEQIKLTNRETDVLLQLSKGLSYKDMAKNLIISAGTIRKHVENIYKKLQVHNKVEAIAKARGNRLI